jgi:cellulose synthase/poly-beta-1,6-N-acetylglucosamine synthase-like glycosyltransferase
MSHVELVSITAAVVVAYTYIGFPLLTMLRALIWRRPFFRADSTPSVSLIICCYNEADSIEAKLQNVLSLDYPADRLEVIISSDGSSDATEDIVRRFVDERLRLLCLPRGGKALALNAAASQATGEILVFSDANSMYAPDAIRRLVAPFADQTVGGVAGNQVYLKRSDEGSTAPGEQSYWNFDRWMKALQSRSGNVISATGAIYAVRRALFHSVPEGVTDDFVTSTRVIAQGQRLVFEPLAICYEPAAKGSQAEFGRKTRIITRGLRGVLTMKSLLNPFRYGYYSVQLFSHKVLRRLVVFPLLMLAVAVPLLWHVSPLYRIVAVLEAAFLGAAAVGLLFAMRGRKAPKAIAIPYFFCLINFAVLVAVCNVLRGRKIAVWNPHRVQTAELVKTR